MCSSSPASWRRSSREAGWSRSTAPTTCCPRGTPPGSTSWPKSTRSLLQHGNHMGAQPSANRAARPASPATSARFRVRADGYRGLVRIATWNVNSVKQRLPRLLPWLDQRQPDVVCLQETKLSDDAFTALLDDELSARGYEVAAHGEAAWNGVAILSRAGLEEVVRG